MRALIFLALLSACGSSQTTAPQYSKPTCILAETWVYYVLPDGRLHPVDKYLCTDAQGLTCLKIVSQDSPDVIVDCNPVRGGI